MAKETFTSADFELNGLKASDFINELKKIIKKEPNAVISIRQCDGTDFPPFVAVESPEEFEKVNIEGNFPCLC